MAVDAVVGTLANHDWGSVQFVSPESRGIYLVVPIGYLANGILGIVRFMANITKAPSATPSHPGSIVKRVRRQPSVGQCIAPQYDGGH